MGKSTIWTPKVTERSTEEEAARRKDASVRMLPIYDDICIIMSSIIVPQSRRRLSFINNQILVEPDGLTMDSDLTVNLPFVCVKPSHFNWDVISNLYDETVNFGRSSIMDIQDYPSVLNFKNQLYNYIKDKVDEIIKLRKVNCTTEVIVNVTKDYKVGIDDTLLDVNVKIILSFK